METQLQRAIRALREGGVVAYPTDTVYGLGANGFDPDAVHRVYRMKRRALTLPVPLLVADLEMLYTVVATIPEEAVALVEHFMPGPLTLVLPKAAAVPDIVTAGGDSVAVRIPGHQAPIRLARGLGAPLVGTSANRSGRPSVTTAGEVRAELGSEVDVIVEGECPGGVESTVVDFTGGKLKVVREGAISLGELERVLASRED